MATYREIQNYIKQKYGFVPETCWIAHAKEKCGIPIRPAPNRIYVDKRVRPCPEDKFPAIREALKHFGMI